MTSAGLTAATCASLNSSAKSRSRWLLALVLVAFAALATLYNSVVPLGEGPDEPGHMRYVLFLARAGRLPVQQAHGEDDVPGEGHQPPLAYALMLPAVWWLPPSEMQLEQSANPAFVWNGGHESAAFVRASREYPPWQGVTLAWHLARGLSALWGGVAVVATWGAARAATRREGVALLAAALVAFNPQFLFTSALVTNDTLLAALSAGLLWLCVVWVGSDGWHALRYAIGAGGLFGLALLTKQSALLWGPLLLWVSWMAGRGNVRRVLLLIGVWGSTALLVAGWWYGRNWHLYGDPFGMAVFRAVFATQPFVWHSAAAWVGALEQLHASFWAYFGWLSLRPPGWVLALYALLEVAAAAGLVRRLYQQRKTPDGPESRALWRIASVVLFLPLLALAWTVSFALTAGLVAWQGRMLFPALPALALVLACGVSVWAPPRRRVGAGGGVAGVLGILALALPVLVIAPAYPWPTLPPREAQARIANPVYARFAYAWEQGIVLRGWRLDSPGPTVQAGQPLTVTLTWQALERGPRPLVVFVHLLDEQGEIVAEDNAAPQGGAFPITQWTNGDWVEDAHRLELPADVPLGAYRLRVGLWEPPFQGKRVDVWNAEGERMGDAFDIPDAIMIERGLRASRRSSPATPQSVLRAGPALRPAAAWPVSHSAPDALSSPRLARKFLRDASTHRSGSY